MLTDEIPNSNDNAVVINDEHVSSLFWTFLRTLLAVAKNFQVSKL